MGLQMTISRCKVKSDSKERKPIIMTKPNNPGSLQDLINEKGNLVDTSSNKTLAPRYRARTGLTAAFIPPEFHELAR